MRITWNTDVNAPGCPGEIVADDGRTLLIQTDWDYPGTASTFGWDIRSVQNAKRNGDFDYFAECGVFRCTSCKHAAYPMACEASERPVSTFKGIETEHTYECPECGEAVENFVPCDHDGTDGTVDCKECGLKAGDFISAAGEWLNDNDGATADDPGYFGAE